MSETVTPLEIKERDLNPLPEYYESITNNPTKEVIAGRYNSYDNLIQFVEILNIPVNVSAAIPGDGEGGEGTPGSGSAQVSHGVDTGRVPFIDIYTVDLQSFMEPITVEITYDIQNIYITIDNPSVDFSFTIDFKAIVYNVKSKVSLD